MNQPGFAAALLDPRQPVPADLLAWNGSDPTARFAVYRNNVVTSLIGALADTSPVLRQWVGDQFFDAMARCYVCEHPPTSPVLTDYGDGFADWSAHFEPAAGLPGLADLARLERARVRACHAVDLTPLGADDLARHLADPAALPDARLDLHPGATVIRSAFPVVSVWVAHQGDPTHIGAIPPRPEAALVHRDGDDVLVLPLALSTALFLQALMAGRTLGQAVADATAPATALTPTDAPDPPLDLAASLALLIRHGALVAWHTPGDTP